METNLLPILQSQAAPMTLCSVCPAPGSCCKHFSLFLDGTVLTHWKDEGIEAANASVIERDLPFRAEGIRDEYVAGSGRAYLVWWYSCDKVTPDGRCSIYETRPDTCRIFVPGQEPLCKPFYREAVN